MGVVAAGRDMENDLASCDFRRDEKRGNAHPVGFRMNESQHPLLE
jgi:hypothetical protein